MKDIFYTGVLKMAWIGSDRWKTSLHSSVKDWSELNDNSFSTPVLKIDQIGSMKDIFKTGVLKIDRIGSMKDIFNTSVEKMDRIEKMDQIW